MDKIELKRIFLERIKREASYQWILTDDLINEITKAYAGEKKLCKYDIKTFDNPFSMALDFYNKYYPSYYKIIRAGSIFVFLLWFLYDLLVGAYVSLITDVILIVSNALAVYKLDIKNKS